MLWPSLKWSSSTVQASHISSGPTWLAEIHFTISNIYLPVWLAEEVHDVHHKYNAGMPVGSLELLL
jgi:hypothetical protein